MEKTLKQLADDYNALVLAAGLGTMKCVKRFSDRKSAERRLAAFQAQFPDVEATADPSAGPVGVVPPPSPDEEEVVAAPVPKKKKGLNPFGSVAAMRVLYDLRVKNPDTTRKEYVTAAVATGIKKSTAARQWQFSQEALEERFGGTK